MIFFSGFFWIRRGVRRASRRERRLSMVVARFRKKFTIVMRSSRRNYEYAADGGERLIVRARETIPRCTTIRLEH
jgi:hypothetical protein